MIDLGANKYITIDGDYQGARHLILQNNSGTGDNPLLYGFASNSNFMAGITVKNLEVKQSGSGIKIAYVGGAQRAEFSNLYIHDIRCEAGLDLDGAQDRVGGNLYDTGALIHDNIIQVNNQGADNGLGPDAIQCTNGCTLYNNIITAAPGTMSCSQHQDGLQVGGTYYKAYNNSFYCLANASIEATNWAGDAGHLRAWNNTFAQCSTQPNSHAFDTYTESGALDDVLVYENTFADFTGFIGVRLDLGSTSIPITNSAIKNNIFYNVGTPIRAANGNYTCGSGLVIDSNNINAGAGGGTSTICDGSSYNSSNLQTGAPVFVSYTQYSSGNDFHLQASSDADIGHGANLGSPYDLDKDGRSRGSSWDIGAYQFASRPDPPFITDVVVH
jgi:hypothetical protein